jgi:HD-GYP domain-containing protein (c-di-GMP phosphodiesterase class II)
MALSQHRGGDASLSQHALATCTLSLMLGQAFHLNPLELQELATAALLHDIGLLQIPPALISRAHVTSPPLSEIERRKFRSHPRLSVEALERQGGFNQSVLHLVWHHHPAYTVNSTLGPSPSQSILDRTGILVLADTYDELLTGFGGASPYGPQQAIQRLYIDASQCGLNRNILAQFISTVGIYPVHSHVKLNTNETAVVTALNANKLHQPVVTITHDSEGIELPEPIAVDLAHQADQQHPRSIALVLDDRALPTSPRISRAA